MNLSEQELQKLIELNRKIGNAELEARRDVSHECAS